MTFLARCPLLACLLLPVALGLHGCNKKEEAGAGGRGRGGGGPVPVVDGQIIRKDLPVTLRAVGNVRPVQSVSVKPQVGGQIKEVHFEEGQEVKKGDLLFTIDERPFQVALAQARAGLEQTKAQQGSAQDQARRYTSLSKTGVVAREQVVQIQSSAEALNANVDAVQGGVQAAQLQLEYCSIRSPITGRTGRRMVDLGNVVRANETDLVTVNQIAPIEVGFSVPERFAGQVRSTSGADKLTVRAMVTGPEAREATGELTFIDNSVQAGTGTIALEATFPNEERTLWPGQFVDVTLVLSVQTNAVVAPAASVQSGQQGQYVVIIRPDGSTERRPVKIDRTLESEVVIAQGLEGGERVVVDGHIRLTPDSKVQVKPPVAPVGAPARQATAAAAQPAP